MITSKAQLKKLDELKGDNKKCPVCGRMMYTSDADELEYIRTKRKTDIFIHTKCVKNW